MLSSISDTLFSPLGKEYCSYYFALSILSFAISFLVLFKIVLSMFNKKKFVPQAFMIVSTPLLFYFNNRLLYSICIR